MTMGLRSVIIFDMETDYNELVQKILKQLPERSRKIIMRRFGLNKSGRNESLASIGQSYGVTRERIRQIESDSLKRIKKATDSSELKKEIEKIEDFFDKQLEQFGGVRKEEDLIAPFDSQTKKQILFLLRLTDKLKRDKGSKYLYPFWYNNYQKACSAKKLVFELVEKFKQEGKIKSFEELLKEKKGLTKEALTSYLGISRQIRQSADSQKIGLASFSEINPRTVKDKIVLILEKQKKPLHFNEITNLMNILNEEMEKKNNRSLKLHPQTVHNELIRSNEFVLVGRGLYALKDWGYEPGTVKEVIARILKEANNQSLTEEEITSAVLKQRMVKESTIFSSLQDKNLFEKDGKKRYKMREA